MLVLLTEYKMKIEPVRIMDISAEYYCKWGIPWNRTAVFHRSECIIAEARSGRDWKNVVFTDPIMFKDIDYYFIAVCSIYDAVRSVK